MTEAEKSAVAASLATMPWVRLPAVAKLLGIKQQRVRDLIRKAPEIKRCTLITNPTASRGAIYIHVPSLLDYMNKLSADRSERMVMANEG